MSLDVSSARDRLPFDIYEHIINAVAEDDDDFLSSIQACALVSRNFLSLARDHLFGSIGLNTSPASERSVYHDAHMFIRLVSCAPEIAQHVRSVRYCVLSTDLALEGLPKALIMLTRLTTLTIYGWMISPAISWSWSTPSSLRDAFLHLLRQPTLSRLELGAIPGFRLSDLSLCSNLEYLSVWKVRLALFQRAASLQEYSGTNDNDISLSSGRHHRNGTLVIDFSALKRVELEKTLQDEAKALFKQCEQVFDIRLHICDFSDALMLIPGYANVIVPFLKTLQHLNFKLISDERNDDPLAGLASELKAIAGQNIIETIMIKLLVQPDVGCTRGDEWAALDNVFIQYQSGWRNLKKVTLKIEVGDFLRGDDGLVDALRIMPETQLRGLMTSTDIEFEFEVTSVLM